MDRAVEIFGTTYNYRCAGFILPNGDLLDLPPLNHLEIAAVYSSWRSGRSPVPWPRCCVGAGIKAFLADGAVRINTTGNYVWVEAARPLTREQVDSLQFLTDQASRTGAAVDVLMFEPYRHETKEWKYGAPSASTLAAYVTGVLNTSRSRENPRDYWGREGAGMLFVTPRGRLLLTFRSAAVNEPHTWGIPGGKVDYGELAVEAARREAEEELGELPAFVLERPIGFEDAETGFRYTTFIARVERSFTPTLNWETESAEWFEFEEAVELDLHFGARHVLERLIGQPRSNAKSLDEVYRRYNALVNMSASELERWGRSSCSQLASLDRSPIARNVRLLRKSKSEWTAQDIHDANRTISFISRMRGMPPGRAAAKGCPSKRDIALMNWGYRP